MDLDCRRLAQLRCKNALSLKQIVNPATLVSFHPEKPVVGGRDVRRSDGSATGSAERPY